MRTKYYFQQPVVFHNLTGYDAHLFIRELAKYTTGMGVLAKNTEDYISFSIKVEVDKYINKNGDERMKEMELRFIDSIKFMSSSLDCLVNNLTREGHKFWGFENYNCNQRELLIRKGTYPYEYMDSWDKFEETSLPNIENSIAISTCLELTMKTTSTPAPFGENLELEIWENTTIYTSELMSSYSQTYSNLLEEFV